MSLSLLLRLGLEHVQQDREEIFPHSQYVSPCIHGLLHSGQRTESVKPQRSVSSRLPCSAYNSATCESISLSSCRDFASGK